MCTLSQDGLYNRTKPETEFLPYEMYEGTKKVHKLEENK